LTRILVVDDEEEIRALLVHAKMKRYSISARDFMTS
jgi:CheY-like chemotaxis protein